MSTNKHENNQKHFTKADLNVLAKIHDLHCVSVYIPPSANISTADDLEGQLKLKNIIKQVRNKLLEYKVGEIEIIDYLEPLQRLQGDATLWRNRTKTLVLFLNKQQLKCFFIDFDAPEKVYVSDHFYLLPLIPVVNGMGKYLLLSLSLQEVKLYEGSFTGLKALPVEDLLPEKLEDAAGYDFREKSFQFRSGKGSTSGAIFHGQGAGKDDKQKETEKFFRAVDNGLSAYTGQDKLMLVLACVDEHYPIFAQITKYPYLYPKNISGNVENVDLPQLHKQSWMLVEEYFQQGRENAKAAFGDLSASGKTSIDLLDIIPAAIEGRVEALFAQNRKDRLGLYDSTNRTLILDEKTNPNQVSLFNLAAVQTWLNGGSVFVEAPGNMPYAGSEINALFRY